MSISSSHGFSWNLYFLIRLGLTLGTLLRRAQVREGREMKVDLAKELEVAEVEDVVTNLMKELNTGVDSEQLVEESVAMVKDKIKSILQELMKLDIVHEKRYRKLIEDLVEKKNSSQKTPVRPASDFSGPHSDIQQQHPSAAAEAASDNLDLETFKLKYDRLTIVEKECLLCYPLLPDDLLLEKRDLLKWWLAMELISPGLDGGKAEGNRILAKLVKEGFVKPPIKNKVLSNLCFNVRSMLVLAGCSLLECKHSDSSPILFYTRSGVLQVLLNSERTLDTKMFDFIWSKKKDIRVVHLGCWRKSRHHDRDQDDTDNISQKSLNLALQKLDGQVRFLSLQGMSGLVSLPKSICKLNNLLVLDLRACDNLETLPEQIGSLTRLLYLDLSECYLLGYIPEEITSLSELVVLKGFIVTPRVRRGDHQKACKFSSLTALRKLRKLTLRSRRLGFPTKEDLQTLYSMSHLTGLGITWGISHLEALEFVFRDTWDDKDQRIQFPTNLEKLELQAVPAVTASWLLELISREQSHIKLEKLYIRGAIGKLDLKNYCLPTVKQLRLRYLPLLDMEWDQFQRVFPNLTRLEI